MGTNSKPSWRSTPWPWRNQSSFENKKFVSNQDEISTVYTVPDDSLLLRTMLDHSGVIKALTWHEGDSQWREIWKAPLFPCDRYGHCGAYAICHLDFSSFECSCLPGYEPRYPKEWFTRDGSGGCVRKRLETSSMCGHGEGFMKVQNVLLPDTSAAVWLNKNMSPADCEHECKRNCSCSAYASIEIPGKGAGCVAWYGELIDAKYDTSESYDLHVRVDAIELAENARKSNSSYEKKKLAILVPISVASACLITILFTYLWLRKRAREEFRKNPYIEIKVEEGSSSINELTISAILSRYGNYGEEKALEIVDSSLKELYHPQEALRRHAKKLRNCPVLSLPFNFYQRLV
ncbi:unnamed protein product [Dovyalis caffra]|uniref:non-specific serine/threonine protein kinase n=1 Tax=Dovyalis caffra TaxID=77055 RepID=A0AAV1SKL8_9ROSI|nr:unnamed protein product [Dovyalis caffra]